jgi:Ca-activated chloride channel family protein
LFGNWWPEFQFPYAFLLTPAALAVGWWISRPQSRPQTLYSYTAHLRDLPTTWAQLVKISLPWLTTLGLLLLVGALARPRLGREETRVRGEGIAIQMTVDISGSMRALDFSLDGESVSRLEAVKKIFQEFVTGNKKSLSGRHDDLIGLVAFGGFASGRCPLTADHRALLDILKDLKVPEPPRDAYGRIIYNDALWREETMTAIGDALALSLARLDKVKEKVKSRVLILLSDGENNAGTVEPLEAAKAAKQFGVKIYAIGIGSTGRVPMPVTDEFGRERIVPQFVGMDEALLQKIAEIGGGRYFHAKDTDALRKIYEEIDRLEKTEFQSTHYREYRELYAWAAIPGLVLLLLTALLEAGRFRSFP